MLVRLEGALDSHSLAEKMVLLPGSSSFCPSENKLSEAINLVVGYNGSPKSHTALDLTLWIAHQTRLATQKSVIVNVVHIIEPDLGDERLKLNLSYTDSRLRGKELISTKRQAADSRGGTTLAVPPSTNRAILQQAQYLAAEWGDSVELYLEFGFLDTALSKVVEQTAGAFLFLGCSSVKHPLIQQLGSDFPCPVLGLPLDSFSPNSL